MTPGVIPASEWTARAARHEGLVGGYADRFIQRRSRHEKHPVEDFLFTYYPFAPTRLRQWVPALGEELAVSEHALESHPWLTRLPAKRTAESLALDPQRIEPATLRAAELIRAICRGILERPPRFSCFGLHEWAMVYKSSAQEVRHQGYELRLTPAELAKFIESQTLCCTHYDAFRFFTAEARPLNSFQPVLDTRAALEQGGCLHANMDVYKWAGKLWPWAGADLLGDAFALATQGRDLDMRASPYDLRHLGYEPIAIETAEGREIYRHEQQELQERATPVRARLLASAEAVSAAV